MVGEHAPVLRLVKRKLCSECHHGALGPYGVYCTLFSEHINDETVADECGEFEEL